MTQPARLPLPDERPFSVPQLAARWGCSEGLVRKLIRENRLRCFRPGALIRISATEVERFECQQMQEVSPTASSASEAGSLSFGQTKTLEGAAESSSKRQIARARRRKPAGNGKVATIHHGPWAGS